MAIQLVTIPPLDPFGYTGPTRIMSGVARTDTVTPDSYFGDVGLPEFARWLYVGAPGDVSYVKWDGTTQVLVGLASGVWHPIYATKVNSSGTTASSMVWGS